MGILSLTEKRMQTTRFTRIQQPQVVRRQGRPYARWMRFWTYETSFADQFMYIHSDTRQGISFSSRGPVEVGNQPEVEHRLRPRGQRTSRYDGDGSFGWGPEQLPRFGGRDRYSGDAIPFNFKSCSRSNSLSQMCSTIIPFCLFDFIIPFF